MQLSWKNILLAVLQIILASGALYLVYQMSEAASLSGTLLYGIYIVLSGIVLIAVYALFACTGIQSPSNKIVSILLEGIDDLDDLQKTIIRLKSHSDDQNMTLITGLTTLLDRLNSKMKDSSKGHSGLSTEHEQLQQQFDALNDKYQQLMALPHQRSEFLSLMGDEITSPMQSLNSMLKLLNRTELDHETEHLLKIAIHSAYSLTENITNILEFTKLDAGLLELSSEPFDLYENISQVLETQESIALSKSLLLEKHISGDVPQTINAPRQAIKKVLNNLISNAIRFTDHGSITLRVDRLVEDDHTFIRFKIIDTGVGVPAQAQDSLFDSLDRETHLKNSSFTGRLRLIVSKGLCELMGGEIGVESTEGTGSQFWFTIRL